MDNIRELKNKPLVEALFEIRWALSGPPGIAIDPSYQLLIGQLYGALRDKFPHHVALPSAEVPPQMIPFTPQHQFRTAPDRWPLVQLGPGLITVNDTEGYLWDDFFALCGFVVQSLFKVYPQDESPLRIAEVSLRYIDADLLRDTSPLDFLKKLKIGIDLSPSLFDNGIITPKALGVGLSLAFPLNEPKGVLQLSANQGRKGEEEAIVWETQVLTRGDDTPQNPESIEDWLGKAHRVTHEWFLKQVEGELLEKYL